MKLKKLFRRKSRNQNQYTLSSIWKRKWAYVSYISEVYYRQKDKNYMMAHQNKREAIIIGKIFYSLGYNVKVSEYETISECDNRKYDIIFGLEPNFEIMCKKNPDALKIYYATGAYWETRNCLIRKRTDQFNFKYDTHLPYCRLVDPHNSIQIADIIFQIGSTFTLQTYPSQFHNKIKIINQSSNFTKDCDISHKLDCVSKKDFIWFGSSGSILKGLDLVLEYFMQTPQYNLHVVGSIDEDFNDFFYDKLKDYPNIKIYGFLSTSSQEFNDIAYRTAFNIFPSASEGCPGSVITLMQMGIIPITSQWGAVDGIDECGYLLEDLSLEAIDKAVKWTETLSNSILEELIKRNIKHSKETWNIERFESKFRESLTEQIELHNSKQNCI